MSEIHKENKEKFIIVSLNAYFKCSMEFCDQFVNIVVILFNLGEYFRKNVFVNE